MKTWTEVSTFDIQQSFLRYRLSLQNASNVTYLAAAGGGIAGESIM